MDSDPPAPQGPRSFSLPTAALWAIIALLLQYSFIALTEASREGAIYDLVTQTSCQALAYSVVLFLVLRVHEPETSIRHVLALRPPSVLALLLAAAVGAAICLPTEWLGHVVERLLPPAADDTDALDRLFSVATLGKKVALCVTLVFLQPLFRELFFRGALFTPLRRTRKVESVIVISAALETFGSFDARAMLSLLGVTLVFSWMRGMTGSVFTSIVARVVFSGVGIVPVLLGRELPRPTAPWLIGCTATTIVGLAGLAVLARRNPGIETARLEDGD